VSRQILFVPFIAVALLCSLELSAAGFRTFTGPGSFDDQTKWDGGTDPGSGEDLVINGSCDFNLTGGTTPTSATQFGNLTINGTLTFSVSSPNSLKVVDVSGTGTLTLGTGHIAISGSFNPTTLTSFTVSTGRVEFTGANAQTIPAASYYDLHITGARTTNDVTLESGSIVIGNVLDSSGVTFSTGKVVPDATNAVVYAGSSPQSVANIPYQNLVISNTATATFSGNHFISGDLDTTTATVLTLTGSTVSFDGMGPQLIQGNIPFHTISIDGAHTGNPVIFLGIMGVSGSFNVNDMTAGLGLLGTTFDYNGPGAQTVAPLPYDNLTISARSETVTFPTGTVSVAGVLTADVVSTSYACTAGNIFQFAGMSAQSVPAAIPYNTLECVGIGTKQITSPTTCGSLNILGSPVSIGTSSSLTTASLTGDNMSGITFVDATGNFILNNASPNTYNGVFIGAGLITKSNVGSLTLSAASPLFTGTVSLSGGNLSLGQTNALGATAKLDITSNSTVTVGGTSSLEVTSQMTATPVFATIGAGDRMNMLLKSASGASSPSFSGPGRLILQNNPSAPSHFDGTFTVTAGTLQLEGPNSLGLSSSSVSVNNIAKLASNTSTAIPQSITLNGGILGVAGGNDRKYSGGINVTMDSSISLTDVADGTSARSIEVSGNISGGSSVTVSGPAPVGNPPPPPAVLKITSVQSGGNIMNIGPRAEVEFGAAASFTSRTININTDGILTVLNSAPNTMATVNVNNGILRGTGEFSNTCAINSSGGIILPGPLAGFGTLTLSTGVGSPSTLSLNPASVVAFDLGNPANSDRIVVTGGLILDGTLDFFPGPGFVPGTFPLFTHGGLTNNTPAIGIVPPGYDFALDTTTVSSEVRLVVSPQPISVTSPATFSGTFDQDLTYPITITAPAVPPFTISTTTLPPGLRLEGSNIVGTPSAPGSYTFTISANNGITTGSLLVTLTVAAPNSTNVGTFNVEGKVGVPFFLDFNDYVTTASGTTYTTTALPSGLRLSGSTIIGTPKTAGTTAVTVTGTETNGGTGTGTINFTILEKAVVLGPSIEDLVSDPAKPVVDELTFFFATGFHPESLAISYTWDFGDGTSDNGPSVAKRYTTGGSYNVTVTASAGGKTTSKILAVTVSSLDPDAPSIDTVVISPTPSNTGEMVTFTATGSDPNIDNGFLEYEWNFGDGSVSMPGQSVSYSYSLPGERRVTVKVKDSTGKTSQTVERIHLVLLGTEPADKAEGDEKVSFDGVKQKLKAKKKGKVCLSIDVDSLTRDLLEVSTDFGISGRRSVAGDTPSVEFKSAGLRVAKTTVREKATRKERGKGRKTLGISNRDVDAPAKVETEPADTNVNKLKLKGDFFPTRNSSGSEGALSRAAKPDTLKADKVTASGSIDMPGGLDMTDGTEVEVALGNILDKVVIDSKGKGRGKFTTLQLRIKTDKTTKKTIADTPTKFSIKMSVPEMTFNGFDTEGVVFSKDQNGAPISIQAALLIGGVVYTADNPVTLKVSPNEDKAQMVTRRSN